MMSLSRRLLCVRPREHPTVYDFAVIGGGSGGMAAAKEAAALGAKTVVFDYVRPSAQGTKWGVGGTCVNVGCVPKKLFHYASLLGESLHDARTLGWKIDQASEWDEFAPKHYEFVWERLVSKVRDLVKKLNFTYKNSLRSAGVTYINSEAALSDKEGGVYFSDPISGERIFLRANKILIATGGRPVLPEIPGAKEFGITSDDIFTLPKPPGKTLIVGGGYIATECAGFLRGLGYPVTVAVRSGMSGILKQFDRQSVEKIVANMTELGVEWIYGKQPTKLSKKDGKIIVEWNAEETIFDTVLFATGRTPQTSDLNLPSSSLTSNGKILVENFNNMRVKGMSNVFAVGDVVHGRPELTPVAVKDGELLARRLFASSTSSLKDPHLIPTTIFTPTEYGSVGLSEEAAAAEHKNIEIFLYEWQTLELAAVHRPKLVKLNEADFEQNAHNFCKVIVRKDDDRVIGFHFVGPNAGEVTQGIAVAMRLGLTKQQLDETVGIHPTDAEAVVNLNITKSSGYNFVAAGGCGGGKCG